MEINEDIELDFMGMAHEKYGKGDKAENKAMEEALQLWMEHQLHENTVDGLIDDLFNQDSFNTRRKAAFTLGNYGEDKVVRSLIRALKDDDPHVRRKATVSLGKIGNERAIKQLIVLLDDDDSIIRSHAERYLGKLGDMALKYLTDSMKSHNINIKAGSITSAGIILAKSNVADIMDLMADSLKNEDDVIKRRTADALNEMGMGTPHTIMALTHALEDSSITVRLKVLEALGETGDKESIYYIIKSKSDEDERVRKMAEHAWERIKERIQENKI